MRKLLNKLLKPTGYALEKATARSVRKFHSPYYLRHNARRLEHLASLDLPLRGKTVLEVGAGIGDHSHRGCRVLITEARADNLEILRQTYPEEAVALLDLDDPGAGVGGEYEVVHCYGTLYHLAHPAEALEYLAGKCAGMLLLETCVSFGGEAELNPCSENARNQTQAFSGMGCRPTRPWVVAELKKYFDFVYLPSTQPDHREFPTDWTGEPQTRLTRAVFVAARHPMENALLKEEIPERQTRAGEVLAAVAEQ